MPLLRKPLHPVAGVCMAALTSCGVAPNQPAATTAPTKPDPYQPAQEQSQEAMPELGVFDGDDLNNSLDPGHSEALGERLPLDE
jgi:hypothetical protein